MCSGSPASYFFFFFFLTADFFFDFFAVALRLAAIGPSYDDSGNDRLARSQRLSTSPSSTCSRTIGKYRG
jgi:hypothetical protein